MPAGTYGQWPAGMKHFGWAKGETVIQLHTGTGPWVIEYLDPNDDPPQEGRRVKRVNRAFAATAGCFYFFGGEIMRNEFARPFSAS